MLSPEDLYEVVAEATAPEPTEATGATDLAGPSGTAAPGPVLVHALQGFVDAGSASSMALRHLLEHLDARLLARFDTDQLHDYRARRPLMTFSGDRFTEVELPELLVHEVRDLAGTRFLVLSGQEPDSHWQRFSAAVGQLVRRWQVPRAVSLQGIPWAAPHTRPVGITAHSNDRSLIAGHPRWTSEIVVPGHAGALVEYDLGRSGLQSMGFSAHVPHYLATTDFPPAAVALLEALARAADLELPVESLASSSAGVLEQIDAQVAASEETATAVGALERQYDAVLAGRGLSGPSLLTPRLPEEEVADGDALAAEFERYLREQDEPGEPDQQGDAEG